MDKVSTKDTECSNNTEVCFNKKTMGVLKQLIKTVVSDEECIEQLKKYLSCKTQLCVIKRKEIEGFLAKNNIQISLDTFKPEGPRDSTRWLSNVDIESTLILWEKEFTSFIHCKFTTRDFKKINAPLETTDFTKLDCDYYACIINTDVSTGGGEHWVCLFVDKVNKVIEYFDSVGTPPLIEVAEWAKKYNNYKFVYNRLQHQVTNTECGVYSLYYIRYRLEGNPYSFIFTNRISDSNMYNFRKHLFR